MQGSLCQFIWAHFEAEKRDWGIKHQFAVGFSEYVEFGCSIQKTCKTYFSA